MAYLSPGVYITERDESTIVPTVSNNVAFFAADFDEGPVDQPYVVTTRKELIDRFGKPTDRNYNAWFQASKYLDYANQLILTRGYMEKPTVDYKQKNGEYTYTKVGTYSFIQYNKPTDADRVTVSVAAGKKGDLEAPVFEIGDVLTLTGSKTSPKGTPLGKVVSISNQVNSTIGQDGVVYVEVTLEMGEKVQGGNASSTFPQGGDVYSLTASHKNGKSFALKRGAKKVVNDSNGDPLYEYYTRRNVIMDMDYTSKPGEEFGSSRLSSTYPLIKNDEEWEYLNTKIYEGNEINPLRVWTRPPQPSGSTNVGQVVDDAVGKLLFFTKTPTVKKVTVAIANKEDFETLHDKDGNPYNHAVAFQIEKDGKVDYAYLTDLFQYYPGDGEIGIVIKSGDTVETFVVSFDPMGVDGNGKSNYIETVINQNSQLLYVLDNTSVNEMPDTYLIQDKYGREIDKSGKLVPIFDESKGLFGQETDVITVQGGSAPAIDKAALRDAYFTVEDKEKYEIDVVIGNEDNPSAAQELADKRKDCIAFLGARYEDTVGKKALDATNAIIRYLTEENPTTRSKMGFGPKLERSMFSAFFANYFKIYDSYNRKHRWINVAGDMAGIRCSVTTENASWWVSAGMRRGKIQNIEKMAFSPSLPMRDQLYKNSANPLVTFPGTGNLVWGNKTMLPYASAFDRINVRNLFSTIERAMSKAARSQLFEFNDTYTRNAILSMFNPYLATIKAGRGIVDYLVICDESNNTPDVISRNELRCDIYIKPNYAAEFIVLNFVNVGTRSFSEVIGA